MSDVLRRKLGTMRARKKPSGVSVEGVLRKVMPRDADVVLSLDLSLLSLVAGAQEKSELLETVTENHLVYLVEAEDGARGLVILDPGLLAGIIEVQVSGKVSASSSEPRKPTRTDGIVVADIVDKWLATAESATAEAGLEAAWPVSGFERVHGILTRREADLLLEPVEFRTIEIALSLEGGAKTGKLSLAAPRRQGLIEGRDSTTAARFRGHLPRLPVELHAVLVRLPLAMGQVKALRPDDVLPLPDACLQEVRLETGTGRLIRKARLGQLDGKKAVRLSDASAATATVPLQPAVTGLAGGLGELDGMGASATEGGAEVPLSSLPDLPPLPDIDAVPADLGGLPELPELPDLPPLV